MGLPRNDDDDDYEDEDDEDEKEPWLSSCFELSLGHHLANCWRGASPYVCISNNNHIL